jgi:SAM-dependent methyltransferase
MRWELIKRELRASSPRSVLELGMGQGALGSRLAIDRAYVGVEPDARSREVARQRLPERARVLADVDQLPASEQFDLVCAFEVLEHIEDDHGALRAWAQHVAPSGTLLLSVPAHQRRFGAADELVGHLRRYGRADLEAVVRAAGLVPLRIDAVGFPFGHLLEWGRNQLAARRLRQGSTPDSVGARTASSGRTFQPPRWAGAATQLGTLPFRLAQLPFRRTELAAGWLVVARPAPA